MFSIATLVAKALPAGMFLVGWFLRATKDRQITLPELLEVIGGLVDIFGISVTIAVPQELINDVGDVVGAHVTLVAAPTRC